MYIINNIINYLSKLSVITLQKSTEGKKHKCKRKRHITLFI